MFFVNSSLSMFLLYILCIFIVYFMYDFIIIKIIINIILYFTDAAITITNGTFAWDREDEGPEITEYVSLLIYVIGLVY